MHPGQSDADAGGRSVRDGSADGHSLRGVSHTRHSNASDADVSGDAVAGPPVYTPLAPVARAVAGPPVYTPPAPSREQGRPLSSSDQPEPEAVAVCGQGDCHSRRPRRIKGYRYHCDDQLGQGARAVDINDGSVARGAAVVGASASGNIAGGTVIDGGSTIAAAAEDLPVAHKSGGEPSTANAQSTFSSGTLLGSSSSEVIIQPPRRRPSVVSAATDTRLSTRSRTPPQSTPACFQWRPARRLVLVVPQPASSANPEPAVVTGTAARGPIDEKAGAAVAAPVARASLRSRSSMGERASARRSRSRGGPSTQRSRSGGSGAEVDGSHGAGGSSSAGL